MSYHEGSRALQDAFDTRRLADRLQERKVHATLTEEDRAFVEALDCFFLATADEQGRPTCSYKGGDAGFVRVLDERTLAFPNYDGNGMYLSMGNLLRNPEVGLLFVDFARGRRLRVQGTATIDHDLAAAWPGAQFAVRVHPREIFPNCPRYIHRRTLVERSVFVPRDGAVPPVPGWKRSDWAHDVLPAGDPANAAGRLPAGEAAKAAGPSPAGDPANAAGPSQAGVAAKAAGPSSPGDPANAAG